MRPIKALLIFFALLTVATVANAQTVQIETQLVDIAGGFADRVTVSLRSDRAPQLGETATLTLRMTPHYDGTDAMLRWVVPEGVTLLGDDTELIATVLAGEAYTSVRQVRFDSDGQHQVSAGGSYFRNGRKATASGVLFYTMESVGPALVSPVDHAARARLLHERVPMEASMTTRSAGDRSDCTIVSATILREERQVTADGDDAVFVTPYTQIPAANVLVELREEDPVFDDWIVRTMTGDDGKFSYTICNYDDGIFNDELEIYLRVYAKMGTLNDYAVVVGEDDLWFDAYEFDSVVRDVNDSVSNANLSITLIDDRAAVINIGDTLMEGFAFWDANGGDSDGDSSFDYDVEVRWSSGSNAGSYFNPVFDNINIAGEASDPDEWDDVVILHEWGHFADDKYGCDDNPGGEHSFSDLLDKELAFGEGYPDYFQSAVRASRTGEPFPERYLEYGPTGGFWVDLEDPDYGPASNQPKQSIENEIGIAATLWDLFDDGSLNAGGIDDDGVALGHDEIQAVYTDAAFTNQGFFDDDCEFNTFLEKWVELGQPAGGDEAAAIAMNVSNVVFPASTRALSALGVESQEDSLDGYWEKFVAVVDTSNSMAGTEIGAVKTALTEQVSDLSNAPDGTEFAIYTFDDDVDAQVIASAQFDDQFVNGVITGLSAGGNDGSGCTVDALNALAQATDGRYESDVWLFTDGHERGNYPGVNALQQQLTERQTTASFALLGGCSTPPSGSVYQEGSDLAQTGGYVNSAEIAQETGLVPYLLTALNSGGQFIYVDSSQLADTETAADILRAQLSHSAGAGRWSDYVSSNHSYTWERLGDWEYDFKPVRFNGTFQGQPDSLVSFDLPQPIPFYGSTVSTVRVMEDGYMIFGPFLNQSTQPNNGDLNQAQQPVYGIMPFWDDLTDDRCLPGRDNCNTGAPTEPGIYSWLDGDWYAVEFYGLDLQANWFDNPYEFTRNPMPFQVHMNVVTGEIRFLYGDMQNDTNSATIGIKSYAIFDTEATQIAFNDNNAVPENGGYKLIPVPPQPTKTYTVTVDSLMDSVGFLVTGFSGSLDDIVVRQPNGTAVNCNASSTLCLDLNDKLVQYVQVDVNGLVGDWTVDVTAGNTDSATFSFSTLVASPLAPNSTTSRNRSSGLNSKIAVDLGAPVDGNQLTGWMQDSADQQLGSTFTLFDNGSLADPTDAGDGIFGGTYSPAEAGVAYLWVSGAKDGTTFTRSDHTPFHFQPLSLLPDAVEVAHLGGGQSVTFELTNYDSVEHCYDFEIRLPEGWIYDASTLNTLCVQPNAQRADVTTTIWMDVSGASDVPSGTSGVVTLTAIEEDVGKQLSSANMRLTRRRPPSAISFHNDGIYLRPNNSDRVQLVIEVLDNEGFAVADGTEIAVSTTLGSLLANPVETEGGLATVTLTSGSSTGIATVTADSNASRAVASTTIEIAEAQPATMALVAGTTMLPANGTATTQLTATVLDDYGDPVANKRVVFGVSDGELSDSATVNGGEMAIVNTNSSGQATVTFQSGTRDAATNVVAQLQRPILGGHKTTHEEVETIVVGVPTAVAELSSAVHEQPVVQWTLVLGFVLAVLTLSFWWKKASKEIS